MGTGHPLRRARHPGRPARRHHRPGQPGQRAHQRTRATGRRIPTDDGQYIPTYREVLDLAEDFGAHVLSELKTTPTDAEWDAVVDAIDSTIGQANVTLMSFDADRVLQARQRAPQARTGLVHEAGYLSPDQIHRYGDSFIKNHNAYSPYRADEWHTAGIRLYAWTVNHTTDWQRLDALPVDAIITDRPIAYQNWVNEGCPAPPASTVHSI